MEISRIQSNLVSSVQPGAATSEDAKKASAEVQSSIAVRGRLSSFRRRNTSATAQIEAVQAAAATTPKTTIHGFITATNGSIPPTSFTTILTAFNKIYGSPDTPVTLNLTSTSKVYIGGSGALRLVSAKYINPGISGIAVVAKGDNALKVNIPLESFSKIPVLQVNDDIGFDIQPLTPQPQDPIVHVVYVDSDEGTNNGTQYFLRKKVDGVFQNVPVTQAQFLARLSPTDVVNVFGALTDQTQEQPEQILYATKVVMLVNKP